jgi:hypothetical protein
MEKQLAFFRIEGEDNCKLWSELPEENRYKIETIFTKLLIKCLNASLEEVKGNEE